MTSMRGEIRKVRLFVDRAVITRELSVEPKELVSFGLLPLDADTATFRARARFEGPKGPVALAVTSVQARIVREETQSEAPEALRARIAMLQDQLDALDDSADNDRRAHQRLQCFAAIGTESLSFGWLDRDPAFDKWEALFDHLQSSSARLSRRDHRRALRRRELLGLKIALCEEEERLGRPKPLGFQLDVGLDTAGITGPGQVMVELAYETHQASWMPVYDLRHRPATADGPETVELSAFALVAQTTAEDWKDVELTATTARPQLSEPLPELEPILLSGTLGGERALSLESQIGPRLSGLVHNGPVPADEQTIEHLAPGRISVPGSGAAVRVPLFSAVLPAKTQLEVAALDRARVVLVAEVENRSGKVLLPGKASLFRGSNYCGSTALGFVLAGARFRLPIGTDGAFKIDRQFVSHPPAEKLLGSSEVRRFECRTRIQNLGPEPRFLRVRDRIPVSKTQDANVRLLERPEDLELDPETGLCSNLIELEPFAQIEQRLEYSVTAPKEVRLALPE